MLTFCVFLATIIAGGLAYPIEMVITACAERIEG